MAYVGNVVPFKTGGLLTLTQNNMHDMFLCGSTCVTKTDFAWLGHNFVDRIGHLISSATASVDRKSSGFVKATLYSSRYAMFRLCKSDSHKRHLRFHVSCTFNACTPRRDSEHLFQRRRVPCDVWCCLERGARAAGVSSEWRWRHLVWQTL